MTSRRRLRSSAGTQNFCLRQRLIRRSKPVNRFILENAAQIQDYLSRIIELAKTDDPAACSAECRFQAQLHTASFSTICSGIKSLGQKRTACSFSTETLPAVLPLPEHPLRRILNNLLDNAVVLLTAQRNGHFRCLHPRL